MPRKRRIVLAGEVHHVMSRGLDGMSLFKNDEDREMFLAIGNRILSRLPCTCYAWSLMDNHFHLLLRPHGDYLSSIMLRLNSSYARYFNKKYNRRGYLFQDRFKSLATQEFRYFRELIRYIHLNPVRAGNVSSLKELAHYPWCGHGALIGTVEPQPIHMVNETLLRFGSNKSNARKTYLRFIQQGLETENMKDIFPHRGVTIGKTNRSENALSSSGETEEQDDRIIGEASFVRSIIERVEKEKIDHVKRMRNRSTLKQLKSMVEKELGLDEDTLFRRGRNSVESEARAKFCFRANFKNGYTLHETGSFLGITSGSVSRAIERERS